MSREPEALVGWKGPRSSVDSNTLGAEQTRDSTSSVTTTGHYGSLWYVADTPSPACAISTSNATCPVSAVARFHDSSNAVGSTASIERIGRDYKDYVTELGRRAILTGLKLRGFFIPRLSPPTPRGHRAELVPTGKRVTLDAVGVSSDNCALSPPRIPRRTADLRGES